MGKRRILIFTICFLLLLLAAFFSNYKLQKSDVQPEKISLRQDLPLDKISSKLDFAVSFIIKEYKQNEIFETFICSEDSSNCKMVPFSFFISEAILNSILEIKQNDMLDEIIKKEVVRTLSCQNEHLLWDFYCKKSSQEEFYYPDLDSTSLASWFLFSQKTEHRLDEIKEQMRKTQFHNGALLTFLRDFQPQPHAMNQDPVANANALVLLSEEIPSVCEFVNKNFDKSIYYTDAVVVFYMLSKAYSKGAKCIKPALSALHKKIKSSDLLKDDAPMHLSMFVTALIKSGGDIDEGELGSAAELLLDNTKELPFREHFFQTGLNKKRDFYYSPAFSAAVYAEALTNIKNYYSEASE